MFVLVTFIISLASVIDTALWLYTWVVIIRAVISWVNPDPYNPIVRLLYQLTDPILYRLNRLLPLNIGGIDLSPIVLLLIIEFLRNFLTMSLRQLAGMLV